MKYKINHIGYLTGDISQTCKIFRILGSAFDNRKICYLGNSEIGFIELEHKINDYYGKKSYF